MKHDKDGTINYEKTKKNIDDLENMNQTITKNKFHPDKLKKLIKIHGSRESLSSETNRRRRSQLNKIINSEDWDKHIPVTIHEATKHALNNSRKSNSSQRYLNNRSRRSKSRESPNNGSKKMSSRRSYKL